MTMMKTPREPGHGLLRLILRLDQAGSSAFIVLALGMAPALVLWPALRTVLLWVVGLAVIAYAVVLAALGVLMAWRLSRSIVRGDELSMRMWRSLIKLPAGLPEDVGRG